MLKQPFIIALTIALVVLLSGCNTIPQDLRLDSEPGADLAAVVQDPALYPGQTVRWGGVIVKIDNSAEQSLIEMVGYGLNRYARPNSDSPSLGRFITVIDRFVDPLEYTQGRELTVVGTVQGSELRKIGDYSYEYPKLQEIAHKLWSKRQEQIEVIDPFFHYYPWYSYPHWYYDNPPRILK